MKHAGHRPSLARPSVGHMIALVLAALLIALIVLLVARRPAAAEPRFENTAASSVELAFGCPFDDGRTLTTGR